jgi:hypothetical protein
VSAVPFPTLSLGDTAVITGTTTHGCTSLPDPTCAFASITATIPRDPFKWGDRTWPILFTFPGRETSR